MDDSPLDTALLSRRAFLKTTAILSGALAVPTRVLADSPVDTALKKSPLIYISPLKGDGSESRCHGEVWFVPDGGDLWVVTESGLWRAEAIGKGLDRARIWVGDFGVWTKSKDAFRSAPSYVARASIDKDSAAHARALEAFGTKYSDEWGKWGPRFTSGLASGESVLLRYAPAS